MHAVLNVIQNRAKTPGWWGKDFDSCAIAVEGKEYRQFSCWNENDPNRHLMIALDASDKIYGTAVIMETLARRGALVDITNGADSYYRIGTKRPSWSNGRLPVATIGHHVFFKIGLAGT